MTTAATIDLNTCQPGQMLVRRDGLKCMYAGVYPNHTDVYRQIVKVYYGGKLGVDRSYADDGRFTSHPGPADIVEILPVATDDYKWSASISADHVEADSGFWAVHQGEA